MLWLLQKSISAYISSVIRLLLATEWAEIGSQTGLPQPVLSCCSSHSTYTIRMKGITFLVIVFFLPVLQASVAISQAITKPEERIICAQLAYLKEVKQRVAKNHWPDFGQQVWEGEIRIMTPQTIFVINP